MKILVVSDSHGAYSKILNLILYEKPDVLFFLGDCVADVEKIKDSLKNIQVYMVKGNVDYLSDELEELIIEIKGRTFLLTHGHKYRVKYDYYKLFLKALEYNVEYVIFGHTHKYECFKHEGIQFVNPGSIEKPRGQLEKTYCIIEVEKNIKILKKVLT